MNAQVKVMLDNATKEMDAASIELNNLEIEYSVKHRAAMNRFVVAYGTLTALVSAVEAEAEEKSFRPGD